MDILPKESKRRSQSHNSLFDKLSNHLLSYVLGFVEFYDFWNSFRLLNKHISKRCKKVVSSFSVFNCKNSSGILVDNDGTVIERKDIFEKQFDEEFINHIRSCNFTEFRFTVVFWDFSERVLKAFFSTSWEKLLILELRVYLSTVDEVTELLEQLPRAHNLRKFYFMSYFSDSDPWNEGKSTSLKDFPEEVEVKYPFMEDFEADFNNLTHFRHILNIYRSVNLHTLKRFNWRCSTPIILMPEIVIKRLEPFFRLESETLVSAARNLTHLGIDHPLPSKMVDSVIQLIADSPSIVSLAVFWTIASHEDFPHLMKTKTSITSMEVKPDTVIYVKPNYYSNHPLHDANALKFSTLKILLEQLRTVQHIKKFTALSFVDCKGNQLQVSREFSDLIKKVLADNRTIINLSVSVADCDYSILRDLTTHVLEGCLSGRFSQLEMFYHAPVKSILDLKKETIYLQRASFDNMINPFRKNLLMSSLSCGKLHSEIITQFIGRGTSVKRVIFPDEVIRYLPSLDHEEPDINPEFLVLPDYSIDLEYLSGNKPLRYTEVISRPGVEPFKDYYFTNFGYSQNPRVDGITQFVVLCAMRGNPRVKKMRVTHNKSIRISSYAESVRDTIASLPNLEHLEIKNPPREYGSQSSDEAFYYLLTHILDARIQVKSLILDLPFVYRPELQYFSQRFPEMASVEHLDLRIRFCEEAEMFSSLLSFPNLTTLCLSYFKVRKADVKRVLVDSFQSMTKIREINLCSQNDENILDAALMSFHHLETLSVEIAAPEFLNALILLEEYFENENRCPVLELKYIGAMELKDQADKYLSKWIEASWVTKINSYDFSANSLASMDVTTVELTACESVISSSLQLKHFLAASTGRQHDIKELTVEDFSRWDSEELSRLFSFLKTATEIRKVHISDSTLGQKHCEDPSHSIISEMIKSLPASLTLLELNTGILSESDSRALETLFRGRFPKAEIVFGTIEPREESLFSLDEQFVDMPQGQNYFCFCTY